MAKKPNIEIKIKDSSCESLKKMKRLLRSFTVSEKSIKNVKSIKNHLKERKKKTRLPPKEDPSPNITSQEISVYLLFLIINSIMASTASSMLPSSDFPDFTLGFES